MKTCYASREYRAIADLVMPGELTEGWTITRINVPVEHRGQGHASKLLKEICSDADAEGEVLLLEPQPSDGLGRDALMAWYERYGFRMTILGYMRRIPRGGV